MTEQIMMSRIAMHIEDALRHEATISKEAYAQAAVSVLHAMRDPSLMMIRAGAHPDENIGELGAASVYIAMIDAALAEAAKNN